MRYPDDFDDIVVCGQNDLLAHPQRDRVALCLHRLEAEVNNGGFHQFFLNSSGELVPETLEALTAIGANETRRLLEQAVTIAFPNGYPSDVVQVQAELADLDDVADALEPLDTKFFTYAEPLSDLVNAYLAKGS